MVRSSGWCANRPGKGEAQRAAAAMLLQAIHASGATVDVIRTSSLLSEPYVKGVMSARQVTIFADPPYRGAPEGEKRYGVVYGAAHDRKQVDFVELDRHCQSALAAGHQVIACEGCPRNGGTQIPCFLPASRWKLADCSGTVKTKEMVWQ